MILKLKRTPGLYLVGFMGCGKTTVARLVADELGWGFVDTDADIEAAQQRTIAQIFDEDGEAKFREIETAVIRRRVRMVQTGHPMVVAVGGGAFVQPVNFELLTEHGISVWLDIPLEMVIRRVGVATDRPLARDPQKFEELYLARREAYARADFRIEVVGDDPMPVVKSILKLPIF